MIGGLYYASVLPLAAKALVLLGAGVAAACIARYAIAAPVPLARPQPQPQPQPQAAAVPAGRRARAGILLCGALVLAFVNAAIWQKEALIGTGTTVYVELAPVDPRSLMQGDYMRLAFALPAGRPGQG
ncbi:GDYXXLXY domain-containing protein, partial [Proteus mirabilis]|uniref:GDYXXLXY domain-containing protein n=1 Tax=Proteus mirabilis TaxID=584 RepID=UPI00299F8DF1